MATEKKDIGAVVIYIIDGEEKQRKNFTHWIKAAYFIERLCKQHEDKKDLAGVAITDTEWGYFGRVTHVDGDDRITTWEVWPYGWR